MQYKYPLLLTCLPLLTACGAFAQTSPEQPKLLDSDRPNYTQAATVTPSRTIQVETGLGFEKDETEQEQQRNYVYPTTLVRVGISKKAELRLNFDFEAEKHRALTGVNLPGVKAAEKGFDNVQLGTKIALVEGEGAIPDIAFLATVTLPVGNKEFRPPHLAPSGQLLFNSKLVENLELQYNIGYRKHKAEEHYGSEIVYSASAILDLTEAFAVFAEFQAFKPTQQSAENSVAGGLMYKLLPNLQLDILGGIGVSDSAPDIYSGAGVTWRIPR